MIYFNHNATSYPKPESIISAINKHLAEIPDNPYRTGFKSISVIEKCRESLSTFFNISNAKDIIFTSGSTEALNLALFGLPCPKHIITTATEHNSVLRPLKTMEKCNNLSLSIVGCDGRGFVDPHDIKNEITRDTTAIVVNHCSNVTGAIQDIKAIGKLAHEYGLLFIVDASQSAGAININLKDTPIDLLAFTGHKSLFGTTGIGGLYINPSIRIKPLKVGGTGIKSNFLYQPEERPLLYEAGTHNSVGITSLLAGIEYINNFGIINIHNKKQQLHQFISNSLLDIPEVEIIGGIEILNKIPVINFRIKNMKVADVGYILGESFDINVRAGLHCAPLIHKYIGSNPEGTVRVSFSHLNTIDEATILIQAIKQIAKQF